MINFTKTTTHKPATSTTPVFWLFNQNNSGGYWKKDLPMFLFIEAATCGQANAVAEDLGVDFTDSNDFSGDRWNRCYQWDDQLPVPTIHGQDIETFIKNIQYKNHPYVAAVVRLNGETTHYNLV